MQNLTIQLNNATLELSIVMKGRLIFGEMRGGYATENELRLALARRGFQYGLLGEGLRAIAGGSRYQHPIAVGEYTYQPPQAEYLLPPAIPLAQLLYAVREGDFSRLEVAGIIETGEQLIRILAPSVRQFVHPDGFVAEQAELDNGLCDWFSGRNTGYDEATGSIRAHTTGVAHYAATGEISVCPVLKTGSMLPGSVPEIAGQTVEADGMVQDLPELHLPASLIVKGHIQKSGLEVRGNLHCEGHIIGADPLEHSGIYAGQSILARSITNCRVFAGSQIMVQEKLLNSNIQARHSVSASDITDSHICVGNALVARNINGATRLQIGADFVPLQQHKKLQVLAGRNAKKLEEQENLLNRSQLLLESIQGKVKLQLVSARRNPEGMVRTGMILRRLCESFREEQRRFLEGASAYRLSLDYRQHLTKVTRLLEKQLSSRQQPVIAVFGTLEPGVEIFSRNQSHTINRTMHRVGILVDELPGSFEIVPLDNLLPEWLPEPAPAMDNSPV